MKDLGVHLLLFAFVSFAIAVVGAMFTETNDAKALRRVPSRFVVFALGCAVLTAIMLICEHTFASV